MRRDLALADPRELMQLAIARPIEGLTPGHGPFGCAILLEDALLAAEALDGIANRAVRVRTGPSVEQLLSRHPRVGCREDFAPGCFRRELGWFYTVGSRVVRVDTPLCP